MKALFAALLVSAISVSSGVAEAACNTDTPVSLFGADGKGNGIINNDGSNNLTPDSLAGQVYDGGTYNGVAHLNGSSDCASIADLKSLEKDMHQGLATVGALNIPHVERSFAASLNGGFYESETAVGIGAGVRFDKTWQLGGAVAVGTDGGDVAGKAALTGQW